MLERIRESSQGPWAMVVIALIVLSFVFAGVGSYLTGSTDNAAAKVNGQEISLSTLERAYQNERARIENQYGEGVSALFANPEYLQEFRNGVLEKLISDKLVEQKAMELGLRVSDQQIRETIIGMNEFQVGGQFNNDRYQAIIQQAGFQPNTFRDYMRREMTREQLTRALAGSEFIVPAEAIRANNLQSQKRDFQLLNIEASAFADGVVVSAEEVEAYYQANLDSYDTQERVSLALIELSVDDLVDNVDVSEQEVAEYYELNQRSYMTEEERRVSHILIEFGEDESAALERAEALLSKVKAGADFAELASTESADTFSAENGGDLDYFGRGIMDPAFDESAFGLSNIGDVSDVVKSEFGFHIIKLTDVKEEQVTPLAEVKDDIVEIVERDKAMELFFAHQQTMAELAFEIPDTLQDVAGAIGAEIETTALFSRANAPDLVNYPQVLAVAFSPELVEDRVNSDVIEIDDNTVMVVRVTEHEPERTKSLEEVADTITAQLRANKEQQAALEFAESLLAKLQQGEEIDAELESKALSWSTVEQATRFGSDADANVIEQAFMLGTDTATKYTTVAKTDGNVAVVELLNVTSADMPEEQQLESFKQRLLQAKSQTNYQAFVQSLRSEADVLIPAR